MVVLFLLCFNSMKVLLKRNTAPLPLGSSLLFQFHEGPIKTVRFKVACVIISGFNSMKVRLKQSRPAGLKSTSTSFQFHEGPIKTEQANTYNVDYMAFQFHEGPIKTLVRYFL